MKHIELSQSYLSCVQNFINQFTILENNLVRINMVKIMERHILDLNHISEKILEDNQPIISKKESTKSIKDYII